MIVEPDQEKVIYAAKLLKGCRAKGLQFTLRHVQGYVTPRVNVKPRSLVTAWMMQQFEAYAEAFRAALLREREPQRDPVPPRLRFEILKRDAYRCRLCGRAARDGDHIRLEVDHITPRSKGGTNDPSNLWVLCWDCNSGKGVDEL